MRLENSESMNKIYKLFGVCAHLCSNIEYGISFLLIPTKWKQHWDHLERAKEETHKALGNMDKWYLAMQRFNKALAIVESKIANLDKCGMGSLIKQLKDQYPLTQDQVNFFVS